MSREIVEPRSLIVTPAPLQALAKSARAVSALLPQFLQIYCSTAVALLPLQTAVNADGSGCVLRDGSVAVCAEHRDNAFESYLTAAMRHAGGAASARRAASAMSANTVVVVVNIMWVS